LVYRAKGGNSIKPAALAGEKLTYCLKFNHMVQPIAPAAFPA